MRAEAQPISPYSSTISSRHRHVLFFEDASTCSRDHIAVADMAGAVFDLVKRVQPCLTLQTVVRWVALLSARSGALLQEDFCSSRVSPKSHRFQIVMGPHVARRLCGPKGVGGLQCLPEVHLTYVGAPVLIDNATLTYDPPHMQADWNCIFIVCVIIVVIVSCQDFDMLLSVV